MTGQDLRYPLRRLRMSPGSVMGTTHTVSRLGKPPSRFRRGPAACSYPLCLESMR
jgi:hypothetical protein